jgi:hypothetical protein
MMGLNDKQKKHLNAEAIENLLKNQINSMISNRMKIMGKTK